jgi:hypothetical protein
VTVAVVAVAVRGWVAVAGWQWLGDSGWVAVAGWQWGAWDGLSGELGMVAIGAVLTELCPFFLRGCVGS